MEKAKVNKEIDFERVKWSVMKSLTEIKVFRKQVDWTIQDLSEKAGVSVGIISELENDKKTEKKVPSLVNFIAIARALRLPKKFILNLILGRSSENVVKKNLREEVINSLKDYGIVDQIDIDFVMRTIRYIKEKRQK